MRTLLLKLGVGGGGGDRRSFLGLDLGLGGGGGDDRGLSRGGRLRSGSGIGRDGCW